MLSFLAFQSERLPCAGDCGLLFCLRHMHMKSRCQIAAFCSDIAFTQFLVHECYFLNAVASKIARDLLWDRCRDAAQRSFRHR